MFKKTEDKSEIIEEIEKDLIDEEFEVIAGVGSTEKIQEIRLEVQHKELVTKTTTVKWITKEMAEIFGREFVLLITLKDTIYFVIFLIVATLVNLGALDSAMHYLFEGLYDQFFESAAFDYIRTASGVWMYLESVFEKSFYWDYWYFPNEQIKPTLPDDKHIFYENKLIGVPRLRQLRVKHDTCQIHYYFKRTFIHCFGHFSMADEDKQPFGLGKGTAWTYHTEASLLGVGYWGKLNWYHGGGYYQDLTLNKDATLEIIENLKNNLWITRGTRAILLDFAVYNSNLNLFATIRAVFEFPPTGSVIPTSKIHIVQLLRYTDAFDYFLLGCEFLLILYVIYYTVEEVREMIFFKWAYFLQFWSYIDCSIILLGYSSICLGIYSYFLTHYTIQKYVNQPTVYANINRLSMYEHIYRKMLAVQLFCIYLKIFKYLDFNKNMAQLNNTLSQCRKEMTGFAIMFFVIFAAFAILGFLLFGIEVEEFSGFFYAMFTLLRTILGDFDYTNIESANRFLAPIFFLCFIFLVFFVLLNMFLAIINDTYTDVKTKMEIAPQEIRMGGFLKRGYYNVLIRIGLGKRVVPAEVEKNEYELTSNEIRLALTKLGFTDLEIEMFFARFNLDPTAQIQQYDINALKAAMAGVIDVEPPKPTDEPKRDEQGKPLFAIDDFTQQQEKLEEIEKSITAATLALNKLILKLDNLEYVKKIKLDEATDDDDQ